MLKDLRRCVAQWIYSEPEEPKETVRMEPKWKNQSQQVEFCTDPVLAMSLYRAHGGMVVEVTIRSSHTGEESSTMYVISDSNVAEELGRVIMQEMIKSS
jgi:hypothetical protein